MSNYSEVQRTLAAEIVENLDEYDHDVSLLDLLDALASTGIGLFRVETASEAISPMSEAYFDEVKRR